MGTLLKENKMFRVFLCYQIFSGLGGGILSIFMLLSVHMLFENPMYTGIVGFLGAAPHIISFVVGPVIDRNNKAVIMRVTTFVEFGVVALLAFTPLLEQLGVVVMFVVAGVFSSAALFEVPASTALLPQIVDEKQILQANSLIQIVGMAGGLVIGVAMFFVLGGEAMDFGVIYGFSAVFLVVAFLSSLFIKDVSSEKKPADPTPHSYGKDLKEGAKFICNNVLLFVIIAIVAMFFVAEMANVNRPAFAEYHIGAQGYVVLTLAALAGGIAASGLMGAFGKKSRMGRLFFATFMITGVARIAFALVLPESYFGGVAVIMFYAAVGSMTGIAFRSLLQKIPPKDMVGRVNTIETTCRTVFIAIGALVGGFLGGVVSDVAHMFIFQGIALLAIGLFVLLVPSIRKLPKMDDIQQGREKDTEDTTNINDV